MINDWYLHSIAIYWLNIEKDKSGVWQDFPKADIDIT